MYDKLDLKLEDAQVEESFFLITIPLTLAAVHHGRRSAVLQKRSQLTRGLVSSSYRTNQHRLAGPELHRAECCQAGSL